MLINLAHDEPPPFLCISFVPLCSWFSYGTVFYYFPLLYSWLSYSPSLFCQSYILLDYFLNNCVRKFFFLFNCNLLWNLFYLWLHVQIDIFLINSIFPPVYLLFVFTGKGCYPRRAQESGFSRKIGPRKNQQWQTGRQERWKGKQLWLFKV